MINFKTIHNRPISRGILQVFSLSLLAAIANFIFAPLLGLKSSGSSLGEITALLALFAILASLTAGIPGAIVMLLGNERAINRRSINNITLITVVYALVLTIVLILTINTVSDRLILATKTLTPLIGVYVFFTLLSSVNIGFLQYQKKFKLIGSLSLFGAITKGVVGLCMLYVTQSSITEVIVNSLVITSIIQFILSLIMCADFLKEVPTEVHREPGGVINKLPFFLASTLVSSVTLLAFNMDIFLIRAYQVGSSASYGAALLLPSSIFYASQAVAIVLLPHITGKSKSSITGKNLGAAIIFVPMIIATLLILFMTLGRFALRQFIDPNVLGNNYNLFVSFSTLYYSAIAIHYVLALVLMSQKITYSIVMSCVTLIGFGAMFMFDILSLGSIFVSLTIFLVFISACTIFLWRKNLTEKE